MKIAVKVTKQTALKSGYDTYGHHIEEIAAADLTTAERNALSEVASNCKDCPRADFCLDRSHAKEQSLPEYLPTRESVLSSIAALAAVIAAKEQQALADREQAVTEALTEGPESLILSSNDPWRLRECKGWVADPRLDTLRATAQRLIDQHNAETAARKEADKLAYRDRLKAIESLSCVRAVQANGKITLRGLADRVETWVHRETDPSGLAAIESDYTEARDWVAKHGSPRLKALSAEDIECRETYLDERLAAERPGWAWYDDVTGKFSAPANPPQEAVDLLIDARASLPPGVSATLQGWTEGEDAAGDWAVRSEYLDGKIVYLG